MAEKPTSFYPHRRTNDGSYISICLRCFATVARSMAEGELAEHDKRHVCDQASGAYRDCLALSSETNRVQRSQERIHEV